MAVEARHLNLFSPQLISFPLPFSISDRICEIDFVDLQRGDDKRLQLAVPRRSFRRGIAGESFYYPSAAAKISANTYSGVTYNNNITRKRSREADSFNQFQNFAAHKATLAGDEITPAIQQYQYEIDAINSQHTKKIRYELESQQKQQVRLLAAVIGEGVMKKLKKFLL